MALKTDCLTPGAVYGIRIGPGRIEVTVELPESLWLSEQGIEQLDRNLHNAVEMALAPYFQSGPMRVAAIRHQRPLSEAPAEPSSPPSRGRNER